MVDINFENALKIAEVKNIDPVKIAEVRNIDPLTIAKVEKIAPAAVHIKELNHVDPLTVESLRIDRVRNIEPVHVERFNVTHVPTVNMTLSRLPSVDLNVRRVPPVAIGLNQCFDMPSRYTIHTRLLGFEVMRLEVHGKTQLVPRAQHRREQVHVHERSFPDVAPVGNPGIPVHRSESCTVTRVPLPQPPPRPQMRLRAPPPGPPAAPPQGKPVARGHAHGLRAGAPQQQFSAPGRSHSPGADGGTVSSGG
jgi:hypothetical protein